MTTDEAGVHIAHRVMGQSFIRSGSTGVDTSPQLDPGNPGDVGGSSPGDRHRLCVDSRVGVLMIGPSKSLTPTAPVEKTMFPSRSGGIS